jgi:hypothetical protein
MPQHRRQDRKAGSAMLGRMALGAALAALLVGANTVAARAGDDDNETFLSKFERTLGLKNPGTMEYGINYSERSPLVVPPTRDLPRPEAARAPAIADWPKDADIRKREQAKAEEKVGPHPDYVIDSSRPLRPDELNNVHGTPISSASSSNNDQHTDPPAKNSIFSLNWFKKEEYATFTGEPARGSLTDPPPGYLTPSPDQPYGVGEEKKKYKVDTPLNHGEVQR